MKLTLTSLSAAAAAVTCLLQSFSVLAQIRETRDLSGFTGVRVSGSIELEIMQGEDFLVEVESSDGELSALVTMIEGMTLDIHPDAGSGRFFGLFSPDFDVRVTLPRLESLSVDGGAEVDGTGTFTGDELAIIVQSGSELDIAFDVTSVRLEVTGGSDADLAGRAKTAQIHLSGGSDVSGRNFIADDVSIDISGGSDLDLTVTNSITGSTSGGSDVGYHGNPATVDVRSSGGSDVDRL